MGHLGITATEIDGATLSKLEEWGVLLAAGHAAEEKAREKAKRDASRKR